MEEVGMEGWLFYDTFLEYYLHIAPSCLPNEVWAMKIAYVIDIRKQEASTQM